ncbi:sugar phosphate nucleotidyltransferase [Fonticella tunisiensis]|uniref:Nucleotidyltransferase n=1 Tax=Fonticella tunisiensis TaxID=1096341 RepID=A0A4R7KBJ6_9CLOT|nr:NDP-sugar synthase [Fonticella tunisiensis]TDT52027.1 nucleotidyltransferase [Fonticella tunisiensis]
MKALFLAGGMGTRLRPLTNKLPKPMVPIMGKPLLERNMVNLKDCGISEMVLSTCYKPQYIERYFGDGDRHGLKIHYVCEDIPLGTGGAIKNTESFYDDTFLIFNSDILSNINFKELIQYHKSKSADVTIAITQVNNPSMYGVIEYDENGYAISFKEKPQPHEITSNYINAGVYVFEPEVLKEIPSGRVVSVEREVFPLLLQKGYKIAVYKSGSYWMDIGTPEKYLQAHRDIFSGKCKISDIDFSDKDVYRVKNATIHSTVRILGPVYIGENVEIEAYATIGPNTVIGNNARIGKGSKIIGSVLWDNVVVGNGARLFGTIIASDCSIERNNDYYNTVFTEDYCLQMAI